MPVNFIQAYVKTPLLYVSNSQHQPVEHVMVSGERHAKPLAAHCADSHFRTHETIAEFDFTCMIYCRMGSIMG